MVAEIFVNFINLFVIVFNSLILIRVVMSWINPHPTGGFGVLIFDLTEPILGPIRRLLPQSQMLDFSPLVAFLLLQLLANFAKQLLQG